MATKRNWRLTPEIKRAIAKFTADNMGLLRRKEVAAVKGIGNTVLCSIIREYGPEFGLTLKPQGPHGRRAKTRRATA
jgi:hypothetical protein